MKVVINRCFGGFRLSEKALLWLANRNSSVLEHSTFEEYYGADENGMVKQTVFLSDEPVKTLTPVNEYHAKQMEYTPGWRPVEFNGKIIQLVTPEFDTDDFRDAESKIRKHPDLVAVVEELQSEASGSSAKLEIVEIPDDVEFVIEEYDGQEHISEKHRSWY